ncbi:MAG TPA: MIP/aquaporin family protein [Syntrophorhabdaceae bacterium]|nr:MIP/aquaporin family protein [Syntrophorhabdaceae bacterium]HQM82401.1 MIP/aquaporin family protein [Syntrophorhabdaceae bacterium]
MMSPFLGEMVGTMVLVLLGNGAVTNVLLGKSKAQNSGWIVIATGWAFAVLAGVFAAIALGSSDAHINPAVTLGFAISSGDYSKISLYIPAQCIGAFLGAILLWIHFYPHWKETPDPGLKLACFSTGPAIRSAVPNLISEIVGTAVLVLGVASIFSKAADSGATHGLGPFLVAALVWGIGASLGGTTGYAINPARDLMPRLAHALLPIPGKGGSDWAYSWIPVIGPLLGGTLIGVLLKVV